MTKIITTCPICGETDTIELTEEEFEAYEFWQQGRMLIQEALPHRTPAEREQLKTGICSHCWDDMFKEFDE